MNSKQFDVLCTSLRQLWSPKEGALALLTSNRRNAPVLRLCIGRFNNAYLVASNCILWNNETKQYEGPLLSVTLRSIQTRFKVCRCELTTVKCMENNKTVNSLCLLSDYSKCNNKCMKAERTE